MIPGSTPDGCLFKWLTLKKVKLSDHKWLEEESELLGKLVGKYGDDKWKEVSQNLYTLNPNKKKKFRSPKQCREHWLSFLDPEKKTGLWGKEEDIKLLTSVL